MRLLLIKELLDKHPVVLEKAATKLEKAVVAALRSFPAHVRDEFNGVKYYIFSGNESRTGGRKGGQWYFRIGNRTSIRFDDSIVIRSAEDYLSLYTQERAVQTAVHELSHAYYYYHLKSIYGIVKKAFLNAKKTRLYLNVERKNGTNLKQAYAIKNQREYFAELSKIYHLGNHHYPYNASELEQYDSQGYEAIKIAFSYDYKVYD